MNQYKDLNIDRFGKEECIFGVYMPSNYYLDEISVYSICLSLNNKLFIFSIDKLDQYKTDIEKYKNNHKNSVNYEKNNKFDNGGNFTK